MVWFSRRLPLKKRKLGNVSSRHESEMITKVGEVILSFALLNQIFEDWHFKNTIKWVKNSVALHTIKHRWYMPWKPSY